MSDRVDEETSTWKHTTLKKKRDTLPCPQRDSNLQSQLASVRLPSCTLRPNHAAILVIPRTRNAGCELCSCCLLFVVWAVRTEENGGASVWVHDSLTLCAECRVVCRANKGNDKLWQRRNRLCYLTPLSAKFHTWWIIFILLPLYIEIASLSMNRIKTKFSNTSF